LVEKNVIADGGRLAPDTKRSIWHVETLAKLWRLRQLSLAAIAYNSADLSCGQTSHSLYFRCSAC